MRLGAALACLALGGSVVARKSAKRPHASSTADELESCLRKASVRAEFAGDDGFAADTLAFNRRFQARPTVIVFPTSTKNVAAAVKCASRADISVQPRSGGHSCKSCRFSTAADLADIGQSLSAGMTVDLAALSSIKLHADDTVDIGGGARLGKVITTLNAKGRALPTGTCPDVGLGGHASFGGYGAC